MATHQGSDSTITIRQLGQASISLRSTSWRLEMPPPEMLEVSSILSQRTEFLTGLQPAFTLTATCQPQAEILNPLPRTDAERLALAVLQGDTDAALALADEVQLAHSAGPGYVPRRELLDGLRVAVSWVEYLRSYPGNYVDPTPLRDLLRRSKGQ